MADYYLIEWQGKTLRMGELTANVKKAFATWVKPRYIAAAKALADTPGLTEDEKKAAIAEYMLARQEVFGGGIYWTTTPHYAVATAFNTPEGNIYLHRLLFGDQVKDWTDGQILELIEAKDKDETSDYRVAWDLIWDTQDPKAKTGSEPSPVPAATESSSASSAKSPSPELLASLLAD